MSSRIDVSSKIKDQTNLALQYLEDASATIIHKKLVPVSEQDIISFENAVGVMLPPDFSYWLITQGSGFIDFMDAEVQIPSLYDLKKNGMDGRFVGEYSDQSWKRISLYYAGTPVLTGLDVPIMEESGCCPVISTFPYDDRVEEVHASSWQMYLISLTFTRVLTILNGMRLEDDSALEKIVDKNFLEIDKDLESAHSRAMKHNETVVKEADIEEQLADDIMHSINDMMQTDNYECSNMSDAIRIMNECFENGRSMLYCADSFIRDEAANKDLPELIRLLEHPHRSTRELALSSIKCLSKRFPEELLAIKARTQDTTLISNIIIWKNEKKN